MVDASSVVRAGKQVYAEFAEKNVTFMAAGIAYNAFISLAPMLLILLLVVSAVGGGLEERIVEVANRSLAGPIADLVAQVFEGDVTTPGASFVGLVVLIWGTLKIFRGLDTAFSEIYETTEENSLVDKFVDGLVVLVAVLVAIVATVGVTAAFARFSDVIPFIGVLTPLVLIAGLVVAFLPLYHRFPDTDVRWRHVLPGVVFAAVGWAAFQALFQVYLSFAGGGYGELFGGVIVVVTWLYFSGLVLLLGAVINAVIGGHASGKSGGVGQGATGFETDREESMAPEEFADYLDELRRAFAVPQGADRSTTTSRGSDGTDRPPGPDGDVHVIEQSSLEDGQCKRAVSFRWRSPDDRSVGSEGGRE